MTNDNSNNLKKKITSLLPSSLSFITSKVSKVISNVLPTLLIVFLLPLQSHAAYRTGKKSILASSSSSSTITSEANKKTKAGKDKNDHKIDVEVVITDDDYDNNSKQIDYQKYGIIMALVTIVMSILSPSDTSTKKKYPTSKTSKPSKPSNQIKKVSKSKKSYDEDDDEEEDQDNDDDDYVPPPSFRSRMSDPSVPTTKMSSNVRKLISSSKLLKPPDDILDGFDDLDIDVSSKKTGKKEVINDDDDDDDLFGNDDDKIDIKKFKGNKNDDSDDSINEPKVTSSVSKKFKSKMAIPPKATEDDDEDDDLFANDSKSDSKSSVVSSKSSKKLNFDDDDIDNSKITPSPSPSPLPPPPAKKNIFQKIFSKPGAGRITDINQVLRIDDAAQDMRLLIANTLKSYVNADLFDFDESPYSKADANDDDSRALLVSNTMTEIDINEQDTANAFADVASAMLVTLTDKASELYEARDNDELLLALDDIAEFVRGAGSMFSKTTPTAVIEPVLYNGKAKSGKLENLYQEYLKSTMNLDSFMGALGGDAEQSDDQDQEEKAKQIEYRSNGLIRIQQVFSIKEGKRNSIEQKVTKDLLMNMVKGEGGGLGNIGDMMSALTGKGGGDLGDFDMAALMKSMGGGEGGVPPDMANMSPEEMEALSSDATSSIKEALKTGSITKDDLKEFEKMMGFDIKQITSMIEKGQIDKKKLKELGPEGEDIMEIFKELGKIK